MHPAVERGMNRRSDSDGYYYLSIDEKSVHKGHDYISILSDEATGIVLEIVDGRTNESVDELCRMFLIRHKETM